MTTSSGGRSHVSGRTIFPSRELTLRTGDRARSFVLSGRKQILLAAVILAALAAVVVALAIGWQQASIAREQLAAREARISGEAARVAAFRDDLGSVAEDLQRRQAVLEDMVELLPEDVTEGEAQADLSADGAAKTSETLSAALPEAAALAALERRQLALVERLTRFAERRVAGAEAAIRQLGLNPRAVIAGARTGQGGPLHSLDLANGAGDQPYRKLALTIARMDELEAALTRIPQVMPAEGAMVSSSYGLRRDPFTGEAAMHSGLDFRGANGAPIHAAADGRVSFVGVKGGYGNVVEISHGNGLMTRYAHMSGFRARRGQDVAAGEMIGLIGSTGRSTGPHLHFEVRVNDRPVNPRTFLEKAPHLLQQVRSAES